MKSKVSRLTLISQYELAPETALFSQGTVAAIRDCSVATVERDRWAGTGVPFIKIGRLVRYRKSDICRWLEQYHAYHSTSQLQNAIQQQNSREEA